MNELYAVVTLLVLSAGLAGFLVWYAWRHRSTSGSCYFSFLTLSLALYALTVAVELLSRDVSTKILLSKCQYLFNGNLAPLWMLFALSYAEMDRWITRPRVILLWVVPVCVLALVWTNEWHHLAWPSVTPIPGHPAGLVLYEHGPAVWTLAVYSYLLMFIGTVILVAAALRSPRLYKSQIVALIVGAGLPWVGNMLYMSGLSPLQGFDLMPVFFALSGGFLGWGVFRYHLFEMTPIALNTVLSNMSEGVILVDSAHRIININPSARKLLGVTRSAIGECLESLGAFGASLAAMKERTRLHKLNAAFPGVNLPMWMEVTMRTVASPRRGPETRLILIRDVTANRLAEEALNREIRFSRLVIENVAEGLCVCHAIDDFPHLEFRLWNERMTELTGYTMDEINRLGWYQSLYPDPELQNKAMERTARLREGEHLVSEEWPITRKDGQRRIFSISTSAVRGENDEIHVLALITDITGRGQSSQTT